jgi:DNA-binding response OmpR family regulator/HPt (histidine-containing phosphotransfer) domain-containing protein
MPNGETSRKEEHGGLSVARAEFASSLGRRLEAIHTAISAFEQNAISPPRRDNLLRRLHALGASAKILGFAAAAESLSRAEQQLRTGLAETLADDLVIVRSLLTNLSVLVLRGSYSLVPGPTSASPAVAAASPFPVAQGPWCVLVCGNSVLAETLKSVGTESAGFELVQTQDISRLREQCAMYGPDVVVLDAALDDITSELRRLRESPETTGVQLIVAQANDTSVSTLKAAGAHTVLTTTCSPIALWRATNRTRTEEHNLPSPREPLGDIGMRELCERLARELKRGLVDAADESSQSAVVALGEGIEVRAAIWAAVARIRELVVAQSDGRIHFGPGPDGSVVLAPGTGLGLRGRTLADSASIDLTGRRILVADDDPAVAWFVGGTLRAAGADVRETQDGRRALVLVQQWWPELIVSDVLMPGLDGFALCREVKRDVALRDVPVILLSWKEDLLFRLRELGADADAYIRKEASASSLVDRVRELLWPRISLERRLRIGQEVRGRLDGITPRTLLDAACRLSRHVRITLRDASAHYDVRIRDHSLRAVTRTRPNGVVSRSHPALAALLGVSAGRFSVVEDDQSADDDFAQSNLEEVIRTPILRARAAQRVLSGAALGTVEHVSLDPDTFADELSMLPLSLRPLVDELLRGTSPSQLLAAGATSLNSLESLLSDAARRGAVHTITGKNGVDLLTQEILALSAPISEQPPLSKPAAPPTFSFQLTPSPLPTSPGLATIGKPLPTAAASILTPPAEPLVTAADMQSAKKLDSEEEFDWASETSWESGSPANLETGVQAERNSPYSRPRISAEWGGSEKRLAATSVTKTPSKKGELLSGLAAPQPSTESRTDATHQPAPLSSETPELAQVIVTTASETISHSIPAYPIRTAHLGLTIASSNFEENLHAMPAPIAQGQPVSIEPLPPPKASTLNDAKKQPPPAVATIEAPNATQPPAAMTKGDTPSPHESPSEILPAGEAVFPLCQSTAPSARVPQAAISLAPVVQLSVPDLDLHDTLHSALAPDAASFLAHDLPEPGQSTYEIGPIGVPAPQPDPGEHGAQLDNPVAEEPAQEAPPPEIAPEPSPKAVTPRSNSWLVPLSLALTAGVLSFTVALPIAQRLHLQPTTTNSAGTMTAIVEATPSELAVASATERTELPPTPRTQDSPAMDGTGGLLPPGVTIGPDKGLLTLKTAGVHSIFVDDEFVGRGPERTVTLVPGQHKVRVSLNGEEHTETVEVVAGRLIQRSLDSSGN